MTYFKPQFIHPESAVNSLGYTEADYSGSLSTLCAGCGHDSISAAIIKAAMELEIEPHRVAKLSGIGCSSKTPTYFLGKSHGFNSVHGRMPSVATGANLANRDLIYVGVSGDGDTASIGMGQFAHVVRRNLNMIYVVENNGCYGLTKGQTSATADIGSAGKSGPANKFENIDLCAVALELGATFVARSFSGDKHQLVPLIKAAMAHPGFAFIDVLSPCVTFNNTNHSTKSYGFIRDHLEATGTIDFVPAEQEITTEYDEGSLHAVKLHDGSQLMLSKCAPDYDPSSRAAAMNAIHSHKEAGDILTGLLYIDPDTVELHKMIDSSETPLNALPQEKVCPGNAALEKINAGLR